MAELQVLANRAVSSGLPVLLIDTCSVLDIVRCSMRMKPADVQAALDLVAATNFDPPRCYLIRSSLVEREFENHIYSTKKELENELNDLTARIGCLDVAAEYFGVARMGVQPAPELSGCLERLAREIITKCEPIDPHVDAQARAHQRVVSATAPARPSKQSYKDCVIFEEYLELANRYQIGSRNQAVAFVTSNTDDYRREGKTHPDIESAAEAAGLRICFSWQHARYVLLGPPSSVRTPSHYG